jgi:hypothetical protein
MLEPKKIVDPETQHFFMNPKKHLRLKTNLRPQKFVSPKQVILHAVIYPITIYK